MTNSDRDLSQQFPARDGIQTIQDSFELAAERLKQQSSFENHVAAIRMSLEGAEYNFCRQVTDQLVARWPESPETWVVASRAWQGCGETSKAIEQLQRQVQTKLRVPAVQIVLSELLERTHRLEEAQQALSLSSSRSIPGDQASLLIARIKRRGGELEEAIDILRHLTRKARIEGWLANAAGYELARCYDQAGEYQEAFQTLGRTKQRQSKDVTPWVQRAQLFMSYHDQLARKLERKHLNSEGDAAVGHEDGSDFPLIMLGGFPRSGTTLIESALARHPSLRTLEEKPVFSQSVLNPLTQAFSSQSSPIDILETVTESQLASCRATYLRRGAEYFNESTSSHRWIDKNPTLTPAAPFFLRVFPKARFIICTRDPRDVLLSNCFLPILQINTFNASYFRLTDLAKWMRLHWECMNRFTAVAPDVVHRVSYEQAVTGFEAEVSKATSFLNVSDERATLSHVPGKDERVVESPSYVEVSRPLYTSAIGRWQNYAEELEPAMQIIEPLIEDWESNNQ